LTCVPPESGNSAEFSGFRKKEAEPEPEKNGMHNQALRDCASTWCLDGDIPEKVLAPRAIAVEPTRIVMLNNAHDLHRDQIL